jgi:hypothetical protein
MLLNPICCLFGYQAVDKGFKLVDENKLNDKFWPSVAITGKGYIFRGVEA